MPECDGNELVDALQSRNSGPTFRKGMVTAVIPGGLFNFVQVNAGGSSRIMPVAQAGVTVGSIVLWVDQNDPVAIGKFAGT